MKVFSPPSQRRFFRRPRCQAGRHDQWSACGNWAGTELIVLLICNGATTTNSRLVPLSTATFSSCFRLTNHAPRSYVCRSLPTVVVSRPVRATADRSSGYSVVPAVGSDLLFGRSRGLVRAFSGYSRGHSRRAGGEPAGKEEDGD